MEITADHYAETMGEFLTRKYGAAKVVAKAFGFNLLTGRNFLERKHGPGSLTLLKMIRDDIEVRNLVLEMTGYGDLVKKAQALESIDGLLDALNRLKGTQ